MKIHSASAPKRGETLFETTIPSDLSTKTPMVIRLVSTILDEGLVSQSESQQFEICFEEALKNAMVHGNQADIDKRLTVRLFRDSREWGVEISDEGNGFSAENIPDPTDPEFPWREDGRGIHLMTHICDQVEFFSGGRTLVLTSKIGGGEGSESEVIEDDNRQPLRLTENEEMIIAELCVSSADEEELDFLFKEILGVVRSDKPRLVILDLAGVQYLPSFGIGALVRLYKTCEGVGHTFCVTGAGEELLDVLCKMRLDVILSFYSDIDEAMEKYSASKTQ